MTITWLQELPAWLQAFLAGCFTWGMTALGAAVVFFARGMSGRLLIATMGFAAGVMTAASFWSLLTPSIDMARAAGTPPWLPALVGIVAGAALLRTGATILHGMEARRTGPRRKEAWSHRATLLVAAITLHNVPEGLAVGVAFAAAGIAAEAAGVAAGSAFGAAVALAIGIGLQNFPEGTAVAMPLRSEGLSRGRSFWYGQLSGAVEPLSAAIGAAAVLLVEPVLPYALAFAAGAMLYVVIDELIPASQEPGNGSVGTVSALVGFCVMMVLDVALS